MLLKLSALILFCAFGHFASAQVSLPGQCPVVKVMTEFDLAAYTGVWFQYSKYPALFETNLKCIYAKYGDLGNNTVSVYNGAINKITGNASDITGYAKVLGPATLAVVFFEGESETEPNYQVLETDYKTYAVVFSCKQQGSSHEMFLWILTRDRFPKEETLTTAKNVIDHNGLSQSYLVNTDQDGCPKVPADDGSNGSLKLNYFSPGLSLIYLLIVLTAVCNQL